MNAKNGKGKTIHAVHPTETNEYGSPLTLCGQAVRKYYWKRTNEPVTCKRCQKKLDN
jgi:hypothetical protein